ncbi:MAG: lactate utilization protein [Lachnospiraceae bacterium]|nr:lactate utilization protein [Lachnospiraceae bacterium]
MNENIIERNRKLAQTVIKGLAARGMEGFYAETREDALKQALALIPEGSKVGWGGSFSVDEIGLLQAVMAGNYEWRDRDGAANPEEKREAEIFGYASDWFLCSSNAVTEDGILVNIDGSGNRVSAIASGPRHVLMIVGMNKIAKDVDAAVYRARNVAATANTQRFPIQTPCKVAGACSDCKSPDSICCSFLITRFCRVPDRIKLILVNGDLGF